MLENYVRAATISADSGYQQLSLRPFGPRELARIDGTGFMRGWPAPADRGQSPGAAAASFVGVNLTLVGNTSFPSGSNDGPAWSGRGINAVFSSGVTFRAGPIHLTLAPQVFLAQNQDFDLPQWQDTAFFDPVYPGAVDRPQRFGESTYARVEGGESSLGLDLPVVAFGISTASQVWGPAVAFPYVLGANAGGFPHAYLGTSAPLNLGVLRLHTRVIWGRIPQSPYSPVTGSDYFIDSDQPGTKRFASGWITVVEPSFIPALELGFARFFHTGWPEDGVSGDLLTKPFEAVFKRRLNRSDPAADTDNQLASLFMRWRAPGSGFEAYAEYGREDHSWDLTDFMLQPEYSASLMLGMGKAWRERDRMVVARAEWIGFEAPPVSQVRGLGDTYVHYLLRQGHTSRGQLLGADVGPGSGTGLLVSLERFAPTGRWMLALTRKSRRAVNPATNLPDLNEAMYSVGFDWLSLTRRIPVGGGIAVMRSINPLFRPPGANLQLSATIGTPALSYLRLAQ